MHKNVLTYQAFNYIHRFNFNFSLFQIFQAIVNTKEMLVIQTFYESSDTH